MSQFEKSFAPIAVVAKIVGTSPFRPKDGQLVYSKFGIIQMVIYYTTFIALTIAFFEEHTKLIPVELFKIKTITFVLVFRAVASISVMILYLIVTVLSRNTYPKIIQDFREVDRELFKIDQNKQLLRSFRQCGRLILILSLIIHVIFSICGEFVDAAIRNLIEDTTLLTQICSFLISVYPRLVVSNVNLTFYGFAMSLQARFKLINDTIVRKIEDSKVISKYPTEPGFCDEIRRLVTIHKSIVKICKGLNTIFGVHLLVWIGKTFILLVGDLYIVMYVFFFQLPATEPVVILGLFKNVLAYAFALFILSKCTTDLCQEANLTKRVLVRIKIDVDKEEERNSVILGALKLHQNMLEITACNFFNVDNALLFSICGAASSYLFIMIQLDMGAKADNSTVATTDFPNATIY